MRWEGDVFTLFVCPPGRGRGRGGGTPWSLVLSRGREGCHLIGPPGEAVPLGSVRRYSPLPFPSPPLHAGGGGIPGSCPGEPPPSPPPSMPPPHQIQQDTLRSGRYTSCGHAGLSCNRPHTKYNRKVTISVCLFTRGRLGYSNLWSQVLSRMRGGVYPSQVLWLIHTARDRDRDRDREQDWHNRRQWVWFISQFQTSVNMSAQYIETHFFPVPFPAPVPCSVNEPLGQGTLQPLPARSRTEGRRGWDALVSPRSGYPPPLPQYTPWPGYAAGGLSCEIKLIPQDLTEKVFVTWRYFPHGRIISFRLNILLLDFPATNIYRENFFSKNYIMNGKYARTKNGLTWVSKGSIHSRPKISYR